MKTLVILNFCYVISLALLSDKSIQEEGQEADKCTDEVCKAEDGCRCSSSISPLNPDEQGPQLISLTFEEAITEDIFNEYWQQLLFNRVNPDGETIGATFFVPHEYTDYVTVNKLYNHGFEIGVNSITRSVFPDYWVSASEELLEQEFGGQKQILTKFGCIPPEDILGARTPYLHLGGNYTFQAYQASGIAYDSSWASYHDSSLFPYTLDYLSTQDCNIWNNCPNEAFKGFWILPINNIHGYKDYACVYLGACNITGTADEITNWLINEVELVRQGTREPLTLIINSYWFDFTDNSLEGFSKFLDIIAEKYEDVFLVSQKQVLDWIQNPVPLSQFKTDFQERKMPCSPITCNLTKPDGGVRYMKSCILCPATYPWLGNPDGN